MLKKEVTIYDIARELNVSPSTVSRALKDHYSIGKSTKRRIRQFAADKGYKPPYGRKMRTIGVIVSRADDYLASSMISGIEQVASENGINVIISQSFGKYEHEKVRAKALFDAGVGGLIVSLANDTDDADHFKEFIQLDIPVVFIDRKPEGFNSGMVVVDYFTSSYLATSHLIGHGSRRVAFIGESCTGNIYAEKMKGYLESLSAHNIEVDENLILKHENLSVHDGYQCTKDLLGLSNPPDAIFCDNDLAAIGVIQYAKSNGIEIPGELAVIGFNDNPVTRMVEPSLSTIAHPGIEVGTVAAQLILYQNNKSETIEKSIVLDPKLIPRESSFKAIKMSCL